MAVLGTVRGWLDNSFGEKLRSTGAKMCLRDTVMHARRRSVRV